MTFPPTFHSGITYNPLQEETARYIDDTCNLVISAPTSSGKTLVIEQFLFSTIEAGNKGVYLSPLKALTEEKRRTWETQPYTLLAVTGDHAKPTSFAYQLICMTTEALDSKTRGSREWLRKVGVVCVDEAHLLGISGRGDALEIGLIRFASINPDARIILLSATIPNAHALASWLTRINGKPTKIIDSDYRPIKQEHHFRVCGCNEWDLNTAVEETAQFCADEFPNEQVLIFVHSINKGHKLSKALECPFHYSRIAKASRRDIEEAFMQKKIKRMVSTSTLAWGINLPADIVIIAGANRGPAPVDIWDIKQMAGRAGRYGFSELGRVFYVLKESYAADVQDGLLNLHDVVSVINERLYFHIVSFIYREGMSLPEMKAFMAKSFSSSVDISSHLALLRKFGIVEGEDSALTVNNIGKGAALMYLNPIDLHILKQNLSERPEKPKELAIAFANLPCYDTPCYVPDDLRLTGIDLGNNSKTTNANCLYQWLEGQDLSPSATVLTPSLIRDIPRWISGLKLAGVSTSYLKTIETMLSYGVPTPMTELLSIPGIGRTRAKRLLEHNILTIDAAMENPVLVKNIIGPKAFNALTVKKIDPTGIYLNF